MQFQANCWFNLIEWAAPISFIRRRVLKNKCSKRIFTQNSIYRWNPKRSGYRMERGSIYCGSFARTGFSTFSPRHLVNGDTLNCVLCLSTVSLAIIYEHLHRDFVLVSQRLFKSNIFRIICALNILPKGTANRIRASGIAEKTVLIFLSFNLICGVRKVYN